MRCFKSISACLALAVSSWLLSGCASVARHTQGNAVLEKDADALKAQFDRSDFWNRQCSTGVFARNDGLILALSDGATHAGLRQRDQITSIDAHRFEDSIWFSDEVRKHASGDLIHFSVVRDGASRDIPVECHDLAEVKELYKALLAALGNADREQCLDILTQLNGKTAPTHTDLIVEFDCRYSGMTPKQAGTPAALALYNLERTYLEDVTKNKEAFEEAKPKVILMMEVLNNNYRNRDLAGALQEKLKQAELETYGNPDATASAQQNAPQVARIVSGTGFAVSGDGTILTCAHVVNGANSIMVVLSDGSTHAAKILQLSAQTDIAVLKIEAATPAFLELESTEPAKLGDKVFTIGFPTPDLLGVRPKYSEGVVSALTGIADDATWMQVSIPIQPGNSGGPVVDTHGHVVGIVAATALVGSFLKNHGSLPQNINWAVKADYARPLLASYSPGDAPRFSGFDLTDHVTKAVCHIEASE